jgi:hypothetical protein
MQMPIGPDPNSNIRLEIGGRLALFPPGLALSVESQLKLRELYQYLDICRTILGEIRADLSLVETNPEDTSPLQRASELLEGFCFEADSWGFNSLYEIGLGLQMMLINLGGRIITDGFWNTLNRGIALLSALLDQCETDFRWRLAIADMLDSINQVARH